MPTTTGCTLPAAVRSTTVANSSTDTLRDPRTPHSLRNTKPGSTVQALLMVQTTRDLNYVKEQLGHSTIQVIEHYAWLLDDDRRRNAALLDSARRAALDSDVEFLLSSRNRTQRTTG